MQSASRLGGLLVTALVLALAGCGGGPALTVQSTQPSPGRPSAGGGGELRYAIAALPRDLDPLRAGSREAQLITLQMHEPLVAQLSGPYGDRSHQPGLALSVQPSPDRTVWTLQLRDGVVFQDGTPLNAKAVLANARRWRSLRVGRALLPHLFAVDTPRPDVVRFLLDRPTPGLPAELSSPRLGMVSPDALRPRSGVRARVVGNVGGPGTGPFELSQITGSQIALARNAAWWGTPPGLGPALDGVGFRAVPAATERLALLQSGGAQVADGFPPATIAELRHDPLLTALPGAAGTGLARSVRGIDSAAPIPFSGVWLTTVVAARP